MFAEKTREELTRNAAVYYAADTGNAFKDLEIDLDHAASEAKTTDATKYGPGMEALIIVHPTTFLKMAMASIAIVAKSEGRTEANAKDRQVMLNTLRMLTGEKHADKYDGVWGGVGVMVDERADYIAVGVGSFEQVNADGRTLSGRFIDRGVNG